MARRAPHPFWKPEVQHADDLYLEFRHAIAVVTDPAGTDLAEGAWITTSVRKRFCVVSADLEHVASICSPIPKRVGLMCRVCETPLTPNQGPIKGHHFSRHRAAGDCECPHGPESAEHIRVKNQIEIAARWARQRSSIITDVRSERRFASGDIIRQPDVTVWRHSRPFLAIEYQRSSISEAQVAKRTQDHRALGFDRTLWLSQPYSPGFGRDGSLRCRSVGPRLEVWPALRYRNGEWTDTWWLAPVILGLVEQTHIMVPGAELIRAGHRLRRNIASAPCVVGSADLSRSADDLVHRSAPEPTPAERDGRAAASHAPMLVSAPDATPRPAIAAGRVTAPRRPGPLRRLWTWLTPRHR